MSGHQIGTCDNEHIPLRMNHLPGQPQIRRYRLSNSNRPGSTLAAPQHCSKRATPSYTRLGVNRSPREDH